MAHLKATRYYQLDKLLGSRKAIVIGNNTKAVRTSHGIDIMLHGHRVATLSKTLVVVYDGGYRTSTTKNRIDQLLPPDLRLFQKDFTWYIVDYSTNETVPFYNGMSFPVLEGTK